MRKRVFVSLSLVNILRVNSFLGKQNVFLCVRFIANSGDGRAVLGVQEEDGSFTAHTLSNDHNAQNEDELARIRGEHPPSEKKTVVRQVGPH